MKTFKMFFDIEKEEQWLNEQLQKGYRCIHFQNGASFRSYHINLSPARLSNRFNPAMLIQIFNV
jgi:hypothetical protein